MDRCGRSISETEQGVFTWRFLLSSLVDVCDAQNIQKHNADVSILKHEALQWASAWAHRPVRWEGSALTRQWLR